MDHSTRLSRGARLKTAARRATAGVLTSLSKYLGVAPVELPRARLTAPPGPQAALDIFRGRWVSRLPGPFAAYTAGALPLFEDARLAWALERIGSLAHARVLELGPLEGGHSYMLQQHGAAQVIAVEADPEAYLKCLVVKATLGLDRVSFLCGDFVEYLREPHGRHDLCVASGVLYHLADPAACLHRLAEMTDTLFLWTVYYDEQHLAGAERARFRGRAVSEVGGFQHEMFRQEYETSRFKPDFCGGVHTYSHWMTRDGVLECLAHCGYDRVEVAFEEPTHAHGPSFAVLARRRV